MNKTYNKKNISQNRKKIIDQRFNNTSITTNNNIGSPPIRYNIIKYIKENIKYDNLKYKILRYQEDLHLLGNKEYYISPNYHGIPSICVFLKIRDEYYSIIIEKKKLFADKNIYMTKINARFDKSIYDGTIFDGVYNQTSNNTFKFIINDVYQLTGQNFSDRDLINKMEYLTKYIRKNYKKNNSNITFTTNKLYKLEYTSELVQHCLNNKLINGNKITGLCFCPKISDSRLIYLFNNPINNTKVNNHKNINHKNINNNNNKSAKYDRIISSGNVLRKDAPNIAIMRAKKGESPDVYNMSLGIKYKKNGVCKIKYKHIGFAYIPTSKISKMCQKMFENGNQYAIIKCKYDDNKKRWCPIEQSTNKYPDYYAKYYE